MASIKKRGENSYLITVSCGYDFSGKKIFRTTTYRPELVTAKGNLKTESAILKDVNAYAADFEKQILTGHYTEGQNLTFEKYSQKYLSEYARINQAPKTLQSTESAIKQFNAAFGYMTLASLSPLFLQQYVNSMLNTKKKTGRAGTLSQGTVKRRAAVLSAMLSQAVRWNILERNPMDNVQIKRAATKEEKIQCFTQEQAETFLSILDKPLLYEYSTRSRRDSSGKICNVQEYQASRSINLQLKLFFYLAIFTGCRRGELIALTWPDLDFENNTVNICKSVCRVKGENIIKTPKNPKTCRVMAIPAVVINVAKLWKREQAAYRLSIGTQWIGDNHLFIQWNGALMSLDTPYQAFHRIINNHNAQQEDENKKLPLIPLHGLRHTAATLLIGQHVNIRTVSDRLGHANVSTTLNFYSHAIKELDRSASDELEKLLLPKSEQFRKQS